MAACCHEVFIQIGGILGTLPSTELLQYNNMNMYYYYYYIIRVLRGA